MSLAVSKCRGHAAFALSDKPEYARSPPVGTCARLLPLLFPGNHLSVVAAVLQRGFQADTETRLQLDGVVEELDLLAGFLRTRSWSATAHTPSLVPAC